MDSEYLKYFMQQTEADKEAIVQELSDNEMSGVQPETGGGCGTCPPNSYCSASLGKCIPIT